MMEKYVSNSSAFSSLTAVNLSKEECRNAAPLIDDATSQLTNGDVMAMKRAKSTNFDRSPKLRWCVFTMTIRQVRASPEGVSVTLADGFSIYRPLTRMRSVSEIFSLRARASVYASDS